MPRGDSVVCCVCRVMDVKTPVDEIDGGFCCQTSKTTGYARGTKKAMPMRKRNKKPSFGRMDAGFVDRIQPKEGIQ